MTIQHISCDQDQLDAVVDEWGKAGYRITHVISPDYREGVRQWHLFLERPNITIWPAQVGSPNEFETH